MKTGLAISLLLLCSALLFGQEASLSRNSNLRSGPSSASRVIARLPAGAAVTIISKYPRSGYVKVETKDGSGTGWVWKRNVIEAELATGEPTAHKPNQTLQTANPRAGNAQIYPKPELTPGKGDPSVTQDNIAENICNKAWTTSTVRPPTSVTNKIKRQTMQAYGFTDAPNHYELDHLMSLQVGGCPDCVENLWPEAYGDSDHPMTQNERAKWNKDNPGSTEVLPGSLEKDLVENHVHDEICFGIPNAKMSSFRKKYPPRISVTLKRGQEILATDWYACYLNILDGNKPCE